MDDQMRKKTVVHPCLLKKKEERMTTEFEMKHFFEAIPRNQESEKNEKNSSKEKSRRPIMEWMTRLDQNENKNFGGASNRTSERLVRSSPHFSSHLFGGSSNSYFLETNLMFSPCSSLVFLYFPKSHTEFTTLMFSFTWRRNLIFSSFIKKVDALFVKESQQSVPPVTSLQV